MWILALLVFACCLWIAVVLVRRLMGPQLEISERLETYTEAFRAKAALARRRQDQPAGERVITRLNLADPLEHFLDQADLPMKPFEFVLLVGASTVGLGTAGWLARGRLGLAAMSLVGFLAPVLWVRLRRIRRHLAFARQLPDALQAISNSLRAGFGFNQGMGVVATDLPAPISVEFARAQREVNLGLTVEEALQNMARRVQSIDFDLAVSGILINRQVGGNLAELLEQVTATIRERVKLKNFIRVLTAQQRLSAMIIIAVPPLLLVILMSGLREYTSFLIATRVGQILLAVSAIMQVLGVYVIRRIVAIDV